MDRRHFTSLKLSDFGITVGNVGYDNLSSVAGTTQYMVVDISDFEFGRRAPEILSKNHYGKKVDIWSAGVTAYLLLLGDLPYVVPGKKITNKQQVDPAARPSIDEALDHPWLQSVHEDVTAPGMPHRAPEVAEQPPPALPPRLPFRPPVPVEPSLPPPEEEPEPIIEPIVSCPGWLKVTAGPDVYYSYEPTGETTWEAPIPEPAAAPSLSPPPQLPSRPALPPRAVSAEPMPTSDEYGEFIEGLPNWRVVVDGEDSYFYNVLTAESQWDPPERVVGEEITDLDREMDVEMEREREQERRRIEEQEDEEARSRKVVEQEEEEARSRQVAEQELERERARHEAEERSRRAAQEREERRRRDEEETERARITHEKLQLRRRKIEEAEAAEQRDRERAHAVSGPPPASNLVPASVFPLRPTLRPTNSTHSAPAPKPPKPSALRVPPKPSNLRATPAPGPSAPSPAASNPPAPADRETAPPVAWRANLKPTSSTLNNFRPPPAPAATSIAPKSVLQTASAVRSSPAIPVPATSASTSGPTKPFATSSASFPRPAGFASSKFGAAKVHEPSAAPRPENASSPGGKEVGESSAPLSRPRGTVRDLASRFEQL
ncbi:hypothetical protein BDK51DRAFT_49580 [Blyttiomyces helicus]|uniref:Kinase-like domain-containing protein n=1 Tax=Blyttiomyces helicus TaxID=388810 RepID=A0A4P9W024_9FUNG|nr:hypothetical protein BDK51DRAFT_49580 [Blyttiomyces helicus]|eukprot:RKO84655.1 hypothetical protein BDK51DRAFT_49580 [Blyttiomyces helicus]